MVSTGRPDPGLLSPQPPAPALPMTYIAVYNSVTNSLNATYVTQPVTVSQPPGDLCGAGGARYVLTGYYVNDEFTANPPVIEPGTWFATYEVEAQYQEEYLVSIVSPLPLAVNGTETTNYTAWVVAGSLLNLAIGDVYLANNTMYTPSIGNESIIVSSPINLSISWTPNYLVSVESVLPIYVNGSEVINYANWLARGSILLIEANNVVLGNGTMFKPSISNETITVNSPTTISITWTPPYYLVSIVSPVPVRVNGEATTNYTAWLRPGSTVVVNASVVFLGNGTMLMPSVGNESLTVNSPPLTWRWVGRPTT
ncbi:hypothetical protein [Vulcanisaeta distributa]|uniref:hypothetical protein n=1 Tax=Vulcanisaeta distributa TaxID=164451 RepID=UPI001FB23DDC|nr:hypothetical protein [Vulcanisaeta distributa]